MKITTLAAIAAIAIGFTGCVPITTKLTINPAKGTVVWTSPKDCSVESIEAGETNGVPFLIVKNWRSSNNPQVIDAKGAADALVAKQWGDNLINAISAGASLAQTMGTQAAIGQGVKAIGAAANAAGNKPAANPAPVTP